MIFLLVLGIVSAEEPLYEYDELDRLVLIDYPGEESDVRYNYWDDTEVTKEIIIGVQDITYSYNRKGDPLSIEYKDNPQSNIYYSYSPIGMLIERDGSTYSTYYVSNGVQTGGESTSSLNINNGIIDSEVYSIDSYDIPISYKEDAYGRIIELDALNVNYKFEYDTRGNLKRETITKYGDYGEVVYGYNYDEYDDKGRLMSITNSYGVNEKYQYNDKYSRVTQKQIGNYVVNVDYLDGTEDTKFSNNFDDTPYVLDRTLNPDKSVKHDDLFDYTYENKQIASLTSRIFEGYTVNYEHNLDWLEAKANFPDGEWEKYFYDPVDQLIKVQYRKYVSSVIETTLTGAVVGIQETEPDDYVDLNYYFTIPGDYEGVVSETELQWLLDEENIKPGLKKVLDYHSGVSHCFDGIQNGGEIGIDTGGGCGEFEVNCPRGSVEVEWSDLDNVPDNMVLEGEGELNGVYYLSYSLGYLYAYSGSKVVRHDSPGPGQVDWYFAINERDPRYFGSGLIEEGPIAASWDAEAAPFFNNAIYCNSIFFVDLCTQNGGTLIGNLCWFYGEENLEASVDGTIVNIYHDIEPAKIIIRDDQNFIEDGAYIVVTSYSSPFTVDMDFLDEEHPEIYYYQVSFDEKTLEGYFKIFE